MSTSTTPQTVVQIGIIGAGPAGLAALKTVLDAPQYKAGQWVPTAFEAREDLGGVWLPSDPLSNLEWTSKATIPPTPLYDSLTTNLPHPIMSFSSYSFPPGTPLFPRAAAVRTYLADFAAHFHLRPHIRFNTRVQSVGWDEAKQKWVVEVSSQSGGNTLLQERHEFDLVLICNGHYNVPRYPSIPGLQFWLQAGLAAHSIFYRNPTVSLPLPDISNATILVVGGGPSGQDLTSDLLGVAGKVILSSSTNDSVPSTPSEEKASSPGIINKPRTASFDFDQKTVTFNDGTKEKIDYCVLATGYEVDFPFFDQEPRPTDSALDGSLPKLHLPKFLSSKIDISSKLLTNSTWGVAPLVRHVFPFPGFLPSASAPPTSIAFLGLLVRVAPFPLLERQARAALAAFAYSSAMDSDERWEKEEQALQERKELLKRRFQAFSGDEAEGSRSESRLEDYISLEWVRFEDQEQFDYRDALDVLTHTLSLSHPHSEPPVPLHRTKDWERALYGQKGPLRAAWRALEASGEASSWVEGIGKGETKAENGKVRTPEAEWVDLMWRVLGWERR